MSTMRHAPKAPNSSELQAEAAQVERLRRQIAEMPAKGESVSPQRLAEFARAQKAYLERKIEFEKLKLTESGSFKIADPAPSIQAEPPSESGVPSPAKFAGSLPTVLPPHGMTKSEGETPHATTQPVPPLPTVTKPAKSPALWVIGAFVVIVITAALIFAFR